LPSEAVILSHAGKQHAYRAAAALDAVGALRRFVTSGYYRRDRFPDRMAQALPRLDRWLQGRHQEGLDSRRVTRFPRLEVPELAWRRCFGEGERAARIVRWRDRAFDRLVSRRLEHWGGRIFWGYQGSCAQSILAARNLGMATVAEFAGIPDSIARAYLQGGVGAPAALGEPALEPADIWVAASSFSASCLEKAGAPRERVRVLPLGVDTMRFPFRSRGSDGPLKALFVGKLAVHKGIGDLLEAMRLLGSARVTLSLVGPEVGAGHAQEGGAHRYVGPLHGAALTRALHEHDVLVLPSLYEGFGLVVLEAMASGMPVIATENSCAPDVIRPGVDGFVVAARDPAGIASRLDWCATHRPQVVEMGEAASRRAADYTWERYGERVARFVQDMLGAPPK
jgi:glycosyltransferase involved in cell wall biosynthesis